MTRRNVGIGLTVLALLSVLAVALSGRGDWWGGPAIFGVVVALYWALGSVLFESSGS